MLGDYAATYHPGSPVEEGLVNEMGAWLLYDNAQLVID